MKINLRATFSVVKSATDTTIYDYGSNNVRLMTASPQLQDTINKVRHGDSEAKRHLPAVCWAAKFEDGRRHKESATWSGLCYMDIDHISQFFTPDSKFGMSAAEEFYMKHFAGREPQLSIVHAQVSPSGDGLHIVWIPETFSTMEQAQADLAKAVGIERYDATCKDISRMLFLSPLKDTLYDITDLLTDVQDV